MFNGIIRRFSGTDTARSLSQSQSQSNPTSPTQHVLHASSSPQPGHLDDSPNITGPSQDPYNTYTHTHLHPEPSPRQHPHPYPHSHTHPTPSDGIHGVYVPPRPLSPAGSLWRPPPLEPVALHGFRHGTPASARILNPAVAEEIRIMIPERLRIGEDWRLVYSLEQDGASLATLYQKCRKFEGRRAGFVLVIRDGDGGTFGAYLSEHPHPAPTYFGNGECFLWRASIAASLPPLPSDDTTNASRATTVLYSPKSSRPAASTELGDAGATLTPIPETVRFRAFPYSGVNEYFINCETGFFSVGAGDGHYGLWLDDALERGHSSRCQTFGNEPLSDEGEKFGIIGVELWVLGAS